MEPDEDEPECLPEDPEPHPAKAFAGELDLSEEQIDKQEVAKRDATEAFEHGDFDKALASFTEAILIGNVSAMLYAKRADVLLKLKRPCACISDCESAIEINPDSAKAYRIRGKAYRALGKWEEAHKDISLSQKLDYDEGLEDMHNFVAEKLKRQRQPPQPSFSLHESWRAATSSTDPDIPESHAHHEDEDLEEEGEEEDEEDEDDPDVATDDVEIEEVEEAQQNHKAARAPPSARNMQPTQEESEEDEEDERLEGGEEQEEEKEVVFDESDPGRLQRDPKPFPARGPESEAELSDKQLEKQDVSKQAAGEALESEDIQKALECWTEAIMIGNASAAMYAKRAEVLLKLKRPCACVSDCGYALEINPDSAKAFRTRGKAYRALGKWEDAHKDFALAQQIDYDDDLVEMQKFLADKCSHIFEKKREERLKEDEVNKERFEENLLRRRKVNEQRMQAEAEATAEVEAKEKYEKSFRGRCGACVRRFSGGTPAKTDSSPDDEQESSQDPQAQREDID